MRLVPVAATLLFIAGSAVAEAADAPIPPPPEADPDGRAVEDVDVRVVQDGDTLYLADGRYVRLIGIDSPELAKENAKRSWEAEDEAFGREAAQAVSTRLGVPFAHGEQPTDATHDRKVRLELDHDMEDDYGRVLAYVWVQAADGSWSMLNYWILQQGLAFASQHPGTTRHAQALLGALKEARAEKRGIWASPLPLDVGPAWRTDGERGAGYFHYMDACKSVARPAEGSPGLYTTWLAAAESGLAPCGQCDHLYRASQEDPEQEK